MVMLSRHPWAETGIQRDFHHRGAQHDVVVVVGGVFSDIGIDVEIPVRSRGSEGLAVTVDALPQTRPRAIHGNQISVGIESIEFVSTMTDKEIGNAIAIGFAGQLSA